MKILWLGALIGQLFILGACQSSVNDVFQNAKVGPQGSEEGPGRRQRWVLPRTQDRLMMVATVWCPAGEAPRPLAVIAHASSEDPKARLDDPTPRYAEIALWLTQHGYVTVLPLRPGHAGTGGPFLEEQGGCDDADYLGSGLATAASIQATIEYFSM